MNLQKLKRIVLLGCLALLLSACALNPKSAESRIASDELLAQQLATVEQAFETAPRGEHLVLYLGSAQHSQSLAFQRDVLLAQKRLTAVNPKVQSIILSNELQTAKLVYPFATLHTLTQTFARIAAWSKKYPLTVVVLVATHGAVDVLSSNVANDYYAPVQSKHLRPWLEALGDTPTVVILSACYSGSFVPALAANNRIVLTAAAADRNSFGCSYRDDNTYFIGELFGGSFNPDKTWQQNFEAARRGVERKEIALRFTASNPKSSDPGALADQTIADFLKP